MAGVVKPSAEFWSGRRVLVLGHTGFKGTWLSLWLRRMGANVSGCALPADDMSLFNAAGMEALVDNHYADIRDRDSVMTVMKTVQPEVVFHLAAQSLVRLSYLEPVETYATNVMGTVHVLAAVSAVTSVGATIVVTSDKCYENKDELRAYREDEPMGGHDPYSSSKGCAELVTAAWRILVSHGRGAPPWHCIRARGKRDRRRRLGDGPLRDSGLRAGPQIRPSHRYSQSPTRSVPGSTCSTLSAAIWFSPNG